MADVLSEQVRISGFNVGVHEVQRGENYWGIARKAGVDIDTIVGCNPEMENLDAWISRPLLMVNKNGCLYVVQEGDSLAGLAEKFGKKASDLKAANRISLAGLSDGQLLFIPDHEPVLMTAEMKAAYERRRMFRSPLSGRYTSLMGNRIHPISGYSRRHNGVDIKAEYNQYVGAAAGGTVIHAGWAGGYGKCVKIRHDDHYMTLYAHLNSILVRSGQDVRQHQFIGRVGNTGHSTGPHLHFTIFKDGRTVDPLNYLW